MASRWKNGWFDVAPRYSAGSPAMVDMATALSVARDEARMFPSTLEGMAGPEDQRVAQTLGLRGIVEWKLESGAGSIIAYDLLTRTWHLYNATDVTGQYERGNRLRYTRGALSSIVAPPRVTVTPLPASRGRKFRVDALDIPGGLCLMHGVPESEVRDFLSWGVYRKAAPERAQAAHREVQRMLDEALEDAGCTAPR